VSANARNIAGVNAIYCVAKHGVFDAFVMRQVQAIDGNGLFNAPFEAGPAQKAVFAGDGELRVAELEFGGEDGGIRSAPEPGMELADELPGRQGACSVALHQVFGLLFEMVEVGMGREDANRHDELPFLSPGSAY
jgi:hypothetical protein